MTVLLHYCAFLFSQSISYTREFDTQRKSVPIQIINNNPGYFYVLRYNKMAHDLTVERRAKPSGEILAFTPLKLDSVNADWFDYEKLDYLFFEQQGKAGFVFEKAVNNKKTIYLKLIDSTGHAGGFIELGTLSHEKMVEDFNFSVRQVGNKLLVIGSQFYQNNTSKKVVLLYDVDKQETTWVKKLPLENPYTGFSRVITVNANNDLFYLLAKEHVSGYKRKYGDHEQLSVPVYFCDSLFIVGLLNNDAALYKAKLSVSGLSSVKNAFIYTNPQPVALVHYTQENSEGEEYPFFMAQAFSNDLKHIAFAEATPLKRSLEEQLTFYDGTDYKSAADKDYSFVQALGSPDQLYYVGGRSDVNYYKELLLWKLNLKNGKVLGQQIIPRKVFYFDDRTRFKNIGVTAQQICQGNFYSFVLESDANFGRSPQDFNFRRFARQKYLWNANLVAYVLRDNGAFEKKLVHKNGKYDFVPMNYESNQCDFVFYLNTGKNEQFAVLKLDGF